MTHEHAFLQDIVQHPEDETLRLIFADWLDDHDQPERAEFIRLQIALAHLAPDNPRRTDLDERAMDLLAEQGDCWRAPFRALGVTRTEFWRGLIESVQFNEPPSTAQLRAVFQAAPIRDLCLWGANQESITDLARLPEVASLRKLVVRSRPRHFIGPRGVEALADSSALVGLHSLAILGDPIGAEGVRALASSGHLGSLRELTLHCDRLHDDSALLLAASPLLPRLRSLSLGWNDISDAGVRALLTSPASAGLECLDLELNAFSGTGVARLIAQTPHLRRLNDFNLSDARLGPEGAALLGTAPHLASLEKLVLQSCALGDEGVQALALSPYLAGLKKLWLCSNGISGAGIRALGDSLFWPTLQKLSLNDATIDDAAVEALREAPALSELLLWSAQVGPTGFATLAGKLLPRLETIDMAYLPLLGDEGLARLLAGPGLTGLKRLRLNQTGLTAVGATLLAESSRLGNLTALSLVDEKIGSTGAVRLASSPRAVGLRELSLCGCEVGNEGAEALAESPYLGRLRTLSLYRNGIDPNGAGRALRERFGDRVELG